VLLRRSKRCGSRLWTPEFGADAWLTCERRAGHAGTHRAATERWTDAEAMSPSDERHEANSH